MVKEAKLGTRDTPKQCNIRIDKSHQNAGLADELVPGGTDGVLSLSAPQRSGTTMRIGKPLACHISPSNRGKPLKLLGSQHSLSKWPNGPLSFLDPPPWCLTVVRNGEMREKRRNLKRPATSFAWSEMMSKLKKKATAVPSRGWSDARQKLGLALEIVPTGDLWTGESYASIVHSPGLANQLWHKVRGMTWLCVCCTLRSADSISEVHGS